ncbi:class I SAM-dependent methyltransferase [Corynebacterium sp. 35RC1]|nr:class I SAM-dependent methyltransferase [Corynebacterium sp. 35RC1]
MAHNSHEDAQPGWHTNPEAEIYDPEHARWSGNPNGILTQVVEEFGLDPAITSGAVLDLGAGEGADMVWLAQRGAGKVVGIEPSPHAVRRARAAIQAAVTGADDHSHSDTGIVERTAIIQGYAPAALSEATQLLQAGGGFQLVSAMFAPIHGDPSSVEQLLQAVARGGYLLVVHHSFATMEQHSHTQPEGYVWPLQLAEYLPEQEWEVLLAEVRPNSNSNPNAKSAHHADDEVLLARKR